MPRAEISNGPSKYDLSVALFDAPGGMFRSVRLNLTYSELASRPLRNFEAVVYGCTRAPGPEVWDLTGELHIGGVWSKFTARYSTPKRIGTIEYEEYNLTPKRKVDDPGMYADPDYVEDPTLVTFSGAPREA